MSHPARTNLNLLPARYRRWVLIRAGITAWAGVWLIGIVAGCVLVWRADIELKSVQDELSRFERMNAPPLVMQREVHEMRRRLAQVEAEERAAVHLEDDRPALSLLGVVSRATRRVRERLQVRECVLQPRNSGRGAAAEEEHVVSVKGAALDLLCVYQMHGELRDAGMFGRVELVSTNSQPLGDVHGYEFHMDCYY